MKNYKYLTNINSPVDIKAIAEYDLPVLCDEIRAYMIDTITQTGGHLGSGLGVVELTVALHYVFDTPADKIIFDVGHQGYPHKIITGRKEKLQTIRQFKGISGFLRPDESEYDAFITGHASNSISAALGISVGMKTKAKNGGNDKHSSIAVIGDGALTGGLAYEALNNAGFLNEDIIVILNDNNISIDKNVSAFSHYFNQIYSSQKVQHLKDNVWDTLGKVRKGDRIRKLMSKFEGSVKSIITPGMLFESMGFNYFGPINGNNINKIIKILRNIKPLHGPILLHIITEKGKGYYIAEQDTRKLHAVGQMNKTSGMSSNKNINLLQKYQDIFGDAMLSIFEKDENLVAISAAMLEGTGLTGVAEKYPNRVFDVGIAEAHAVTFAAGLATQNIIPIVAIYSSFLQRAFDSIIHDCALQNLHIVFTIDRAGIVGEDGATHHGVFDISYLRMIPNMIIMAPKDGNELKNMLYSAIYDYAKYPIAIRYPRGNSPFYKDNNSILQQIKLGQAEVLSSGKDACIIAIGKMVEIALQVEQNLQKTNKYITIINARFIKPIDTKMLDFVADNFNTIITLEDGQKIGGFGSAVLEYFNEKKYNKHIEIVAIADHFVEHGTIEELFKQQNMDADSVTELITKLI